MIACAARGARDPAHVRFRLVCPARQPPVAPRPACGEGSHGLRPTAVNEDKAPTHPFGAAVSAEVESGTNRNDLSGVKTRRGRNPS